jgi:hypothetical protein
MRIEVLYFSACPNYAPALARLKSVLLQEELTADIAEIEIKDESSAPAWQFFGSPTIRVDGLDIDPNSRVEAGTWLACRRYVGGLPSEEMIRAALKKALEP